MESVINSSHESLPMSLLLNPVLWISVAIPSAVAALLTYWEHASRIKEREEDKQLFKAIMDYLKTLKNETQKIGEQQRGQITTWHSLKQQELLQQNERLQWKKIVDLGRAAKWLFERTDEDEDEG